LKVAWALARLVALLLTVCSVSVPGGQVNVRGLEGGLGFVGEARIASSRARTVAASGTLQASSIRPANSATV
jgi:hypothetical protein